MTHTILLADDSMTIQKVVELTFMDQDYQVVAVSDGSAAIHKLSELNPDLVIADVHMPGADGYEVCRQTKATKPGTPVLLLVGTFEQFDQQAAVAAGADGNLKKPFDSQELLGQVERLLNQAGGGGSEPVLAEPVLAEPVLPESIAPEPIVPEAVIPEAVVPEAVVPEAVVPEAVVPEAEVIELVPEDSPQAAPETVHVESLAEPAAIELSQGAESGEAAMTELAAAEPVAAEPAAAISEPAPPAPAAAQVDGNAATRPMAATQPAAASLSDDEVERIARRVAELISERTIDDVVWEVVPDLAEVVIKERIRELESQVESA